MNLKTLFSRRTVMVSAIALSAFGLATPARAQAFPSKPLRIVVPFAAGGAGDLTARIVGAALSQSLGQPVTIENRPGAGGVVAASTVARAEPDGHTLFLMSNGTAVTASLYKSLPYDTLKDFTPVSTLGTFDLVVLVPADSPHKTLGDLVAFAKAHPNQLNIGSINIGSTQNLAAELFKSSAGIDAQTVPFNGTPNLIGALRGRQVDVGVEIPASDWLRVTAQDLMGFAPVYGVILAVGWLFALPVASGLARWWPAGRRVLLALAAGVGMVVAVRAVDAVAPMPVFIDATRGLPGLLAMAAGAVVAGWLYARLCAR